MAEKRKVQNLEENKSELSFESPDTQVGQKLEILQKERRDKRQKLLDELTAAENHIGNIKALLYYFGNNSNLTIMDGSSDPDVELSFTRIRRAVAYTLKDGNEEDKLFQNLRKKIKPSK